MKIKEFITFFATCFSLVGLVGGIGYAIYSKAYFIAFCIAVLGHTAWRWHKDRWDNTLNPKY